MFAEKSRTPDPEGLFDFSPPSSHQGRGVEPSAGASKLSRVWKCVALQRFQMFLTSICLQPWKLMGVRALEEPGEPAGPSTALRR